LLLITLAVLVVLINAAFQDGTPGTRVAALIRKSARVAALLLLPLAILAAYALAVRVGDYGWSARRIIAGATVAVAACYAGGYALAALRRNTWLGLIAGVNVFTACLIVALLLLTLSPLLDPTRLAVQSQIARFHAGQVSAAQFDVDYLRFDGARYGPAALKQLQAQASGSEAPLLRQRIATVLTKRERDQSDRMASPPIDIAANLTTWPASAQLPQSFLRSKWDTWNGYYFPSCLTESGHRCDAYMVDVTGDGKAEIIIVSDKSSRGSVVMSESGPGHWQAIGTLQDDIAACRPLRESMRSGAIKAVAPLVNDLDIAGQRILIQRDYRAQQPKCPGI
jgi:hypothetical protein